MKMSLLLFLTFCSLVPFDASAGTACRKTAASAEEVARAAAVAARTFADLESHDAPLALLARTGTDLSKYGLKYSHVGFVVRDHADGRWTVVHLLNLCGTDRSALFAEGLINFYLDDLVSFDTKIVWLKAPQAERLLREINSPAIAQLHQARYNVIARPDSSDYQNSTSWALEVLVDGAARANGSHRREDVQREEIQLGYRADALAIAYSKRLVGGLFAANVSFTDHSLATRLSGHYPVVSVRSIFRLAREQGWVAEELVLGSAGSE
jgi:hypothetical protein